MRKLLFLFAVTCPLNAHADTLSLGREGMDNTFVWRSMADYSEAIRLISAGAHKEHPELVFALMACMVRPGTKATMLGRSGAAVEVIVDDGPHRGCRGYVAVEDAPEGR